MSSIFVRNFYRTFGEVVAPDGWSHDLAAGQLLCRLGPRSSGEITSLVAIAVPDEIEDANVLFDSMAVTDASERGRGRVLRQERLHTIKSGESDRWLSIETSGRELPEVATAIRVRRRESAISREVRSREGNRCIRERRGAT